MSSFNRLFSGNPDPPPSIGRKFKQWSFSAIRDEIYDVSLKRASSVPVSGCLLPTSGFGDEYSDEKYLKCPLSARKQTSDVDIRSVRATSGLSYRRLHSNTYVARSFEQFPVGHQATSGPADLSDFSTNPAFQYRPIPCYGPDESPSIEHPVRPTVTSGPRRLSFSPDLSV